MHNTSSLFFVFFCLHSCRETADVIMICLQLCLPITLFYWWFIAFFKFIIMIVIEIFSERIILQPEWTRASHARKCFRQHLLQNFLTFLQLPDYCLWMSDLLTYLCCGTLNGTRVKSRRLNSRLFFNALTSLSIRNCYSGLEYQLLPLSIWHLHAADDAYHHYIVSSTEFRKAASTDFM